MLAAVVVLVPLLATILVWVTKDTPLPASTVPNSVNGRTSRGLVLIFALLTTVFLSVQLEQLSGRGELGETVHRLGLATYFLVATSLVLDQVLYFYKFSSKTTQIIAWLRNWLLLTGLSASVLHVFNALNYELDWNLGNFELLSQQRQIGLILGVVTFSLGLGVVASNPKLASVKLFGVRVASVVYLVLIVGLAHAFTVGTDFVNKGPYAASLIMTLVLLIDLSILRLLQKLNKWLIVFMLLIVTIGSLSVLNSRYDKEVHRHSYMLAEPFSILA